MLHSIMRVFFPSDWTLVREYWRKNLTSGKEDHKRQHLLASAPAVQDLDRTLVRDETRPLLGM